MSREQDPVPAIPVQVHILHGAEEFVLGGPEGRPAVLMIPSAATGGVEISVANLAPQHAIHYLRAAAMSLQAILDEQRRRSAELN